MGKTEATATSADVAPAADTLSENLERKLPAQDFRLLDYFTGNGLEPRSLHGSFQAMSETSFARGVLDPEAKVVNSGAVGFRRRSESEIMDRAESGEDGLKNERVSRTQRHRETRALLEKLTVGQVKVLRLSYGPQDQIPLLKMGSSVVVGKDAVAAYSKRKALGQWRQVLPETSAVAVAYRVWIEDPARTCEGMGLVQWLVEICTRKEQYCTLEAAKLEAFRAVREAYEAWRDVRGRRKTCPKYPKWTREDPSNDL